MSYFDTILSHIEEASQYDLFQQCRLFAEHDGRRKVETDGIDPIWIKSRPDMLDGHWGFYAYAQGGDEAEFVYFYERNNGSSHQHLFARTVPGVYEALNRAVEDAQKQQVITADYASEAMTVCTVLLTEGSLPTRMAIKSPSYTDSNAYEILFFEEGEHEEHGAIIVKQGDTIETHTDALLGIGVANEGKNIEEKFLEEMAVIFQGIQEKYAT